ncbi:hypothetical protein SLS58_005698 [Diplodia intermedia]|uniref:Uncharacterized protein n=1 Tax=Diplodia intermedia TaxID=856260 RepID=A0ABR3TQ93_9PEZI
MRRNLFSSQLSRRPPTATGTGPSSTSATSATTLQLDPNGNGNGNGNNGGGGGNGGNRRHGDDEEDDNEQGEYRDIVARDAEGNYRLEMPNVGPMPRDDLREEREFRATLQASLQAKVESLDEDKWMFEGDDPLPS